LPAPIRPDGRLITRLTAAVESEFVRRTFEYMKRRALILFVATVAVAMMAITGYGLAGVAFERTTHNTRTFTGTVNRVVVDAGAGDVSLRPGSGSGVTIHETRRYVWRQPHLNVTLRGGVLRIEVKARSWNSSDDLVIALPPDVRAADVNAGSGDVSLARFHGDRFLVHSDSGDVIAEDITGDIDLSSDTGDIHARGIDSDNVAGTSDSGDVQLSLAAGHYRLDASSGSGDVHIEGVERDDLAPVHVEARSDTGDVTVRGA